MRFLARCHTPPKYRDMAVECTEYTPQVQNTRLKYRIHASPLLEDEFMLQVILCKELIIPPTGFLFSWIAFTKCIGVGRAG